MSVCFISWFSVWLFNRWKGCSTRFYFVTTRFSLFIEDLPDICSNSLVHLYSDDTVLYTSHSNISQIQNSLQLDFNLVQKWFYNNRLLLSKNKSCSMVFGIRYTRPHLHNFHIHFTDGSPLERVDLFKYLRLQIDPQLSFKPHIDFVIKRTYSCLCSLYWSINCFTFHVRKRIISQLVLPIIDCADIVYCTPQTFTLSPSMFCSTLYVDLFCTVLTDLITAIFMNHLTGCSLNSEGNFTEICFSLNVFTLIAPCIFKSFWFHVDLLILLDACNIPSFLLQEFSKKLAVGHSNTKPHLTGIISLFLWYQLHWLLYFLISKHPAHAFILCTLILKITSDTFGRLTP